MAFVSQVQLLAMFAQATSTGRYTIKQSHVAQYRGDLFVPIFSNRSMYPVEMPLSPMKDRPRFLGLDNTHNAELD
jgi:hypothetical protein